MLNILSFISPKTKPVTDTELDYLLSDQVWKLKDKIDKPPYLALKANIKGHAVMGRALREEANRNRGEVRHYLREMKCGPVAWKQRINLLCLAVLKGRRYRDVEPVSDIDPEYLEKMVSERLCLITTWKYTREYLDKDLKRFFDDVD